MTFLLTGFEQFRSGSNGINLSEQQKKLIRFQQRRDQLFTVSIASFGASKDKKIKDN